MKELKLEYPTHRLILQQQEGSPFTIITNYVEGEVYHDMVRSIIDDAAKDSSKIGHFVENERILLNNFLQSLVSIHNKNEYLMHPIFMVFKDEEEYYIHCLVNDIEFQEQSWFKTAFIKTNIYTAYLYIKEASIGLLSLTYPQYVEHPKSLFEDYVKEFKAKRNLYKYNPDDYKAFLEENEIDRLYHFSKIGNYESIKQHGLCSQEYLQELGIVPKYTSTEWSREKDAKMGLGDYIRLSYEQKIPMLIKALARGESMANYKIYEVSPFVIFWKGTKFSRYNALDNDAIISDNIDLMLSLPFKIFHNRSYMSLSPEEKRLYQSEVLVKHNIPNTNILNL